MLYKNAAFFEIIKVFNRKNNFNDSHILRRKESGESLKYIVNFLPTSYFWDSNLFHNAARKDDCVNLLISENQLRFLLKNLPEGIILLLHPLYIVSIICKLYGCLQISP